MMHWEVPKVAVMLRQVAHSAKVESGDENARYSHIYISRTFIEVIFIHGRVVNISNLFKFSK